MTSRVLPFVDEEKLVVAWLRSQLPTAYGVRTDLPIPLDPALPLVQVTRSGGSADTEETVYGRVDLENFAATRSAMWALTEATHNAMDRLGGSEVNGQPIDVVVATLKPNFLAWSPTVPRSIATYELQYRPRSA